MCSQVHNFPQDSAHREAQTRAIKRRDPKAKRGTKARQEYQRKSQEVSGRGHQQPQKRIVNDTLRNLHRKFYAE